MQSSTVKTSRVLKPKSPSDSTREKKRTASRKRGGTIETCSKIFENSETLKNNFLRMDTFFLYKKALEPPPTVDPTSVHAADEAKKRQISEYTEKKTAFDVVYNAMNQIANAIQSKQQCPLPEATSLLNLDGDFTITPQNITPTGQNFVAITNTNITTILRWCEQDKDFSTFLSSQEKMIEANPMKQRIIFTEK